MFAADYKCLLLTAGRCFRANYRGLVPSLLLAAGSVEEERPSDWAALLLLCQNRSSCSYEYLGAGVADCSDTDAADYMQITYSCLPGTECMP